MESVVGERASCTDESDDEENGLKNAYSVGDLLGELSSDNDIEAERRRKDTESPVQDPDDSSVLMNSYDVTSEKADTTLEGEALECHTILDTGGSVTTEGTECRIYDEVLTENIYQEPRASMSDPENQENIYENVGEDQGVEDDGWGSSEFEEYEDDRRSVGAQSQNSQGSGAERVISKTKNLFRRKIPARMSWGKPGSDMISPSVMIDKIASRLSAQKVRPQSLNEDDDQLDRDELQIIDGILETSRKHPLAELPPPPQGLSPIQLKRRQIIITMVASEKCYVDALRRLCEDYEKPLLDPKCHLISKRSVHMIFHKVRDILQYHNMFNIELSAAVKAWDAEEKIGSVFTASFSKSVVFEVYSSFVNNFSLAMQRAKKNARSKPAFAEFLKQKLESSADRLSLFGLMVKPVQRFPQFIMLLQDLLKLTPKDHGDRLQLQIALTELDTLTHRLNDTKRDSENRLEAGRLLAQIGSRQSLKADNQDVCMIRHDDIVEVKHKNGEANPKPRRLFMLSSHLICTKPAANEAETTSSERYDLVWCVPIKSVAILDPTLPSVYKTPLAATKPARESKPVVTEKSAVATPSEHNPYRKELDDMLHDLDVLERIEELSGQLRLRYEGFSDAALCGVMKSLQLMIRQKCDVDRCIITLSIPARGTATLGSGSRVQCALQAATPAAKHDWLLELQNVKLALEPRNHPAWSLPESEHTSSAKLPLFINPFSLSANKDVAKKSMKSKKKSKETVSVSQLVATRVTLSTTDLPAGVGVQHLWVCDSSDRCCHVSIMSLHTNEPCVVESFHIADVTVTASETVPGSNTSSSDKLAFADDTVWLATEDERILICPVVEEDRSAKRPNFKVDAKVSCMKYLDGRMYIGLKSGTLLIYSRDKDGVWKTKSREKVSLGASSVSCLLAVNREMWAACESSIHVISTASSSSSNKLVITKTIKDLCKESGSHIECMVKAGVGLMVSLRERSVIQLYHLETLEYLQDINVASAVTLTLNGQELSSDASESQHITCLLSESGLLWIGTSAGFVLTISLPRLEGVPQVRGRPTVSYHAQSGAVRFLSAVQCNMVPIGMTASKSSDPALSPVKEEATTPVKSGSVGLIDSELLGPLSMQPSWMSSPDLSFINDLEPDEDYGSVSDLYGSLMKGLDADFDSELTNSVLRRHNHAIRPSTINVVSNRVINRLSNVISKGRADVRARLRPQPIPKEFRQASSLAIDPEQSVDSPVSRTCEELNQSSSHESLSSPSLPESVSSNNAAESTTAFERGSAVNASYRRMVVPACPSMVTSNLVHVQSSKALIVVSGGTGYRCWNKHQSADSPSLVDSCLLLWKC